MQNKLYIWGSSNKKLLQSTVCERLGLICIFYHCKNGSQVSVDINVGSKLMKIKWWGCLRRWQGDNGYSDEGGQEN